MEWLQSAKNKELVTELENLGVCKCCQFRAISGLYEERYNEDTVTELNPDDANDGRKYCCVCFGILQCANDITKKLVETLVQSGYEPSHYRFTASVPFATIVREKILEAKLSVRFKYELKDMLRSFLKKSLKSVSEEKWSKIDYSIDGDLTITVSFDFQESEEETKTMNDILQSVETAKKQTGRKRPRNAPADGKLSNTQFYSIIKRVQKEKLLDHFPPLCVDRKFNMLTPSVSREPLYITGRYVKLSRSLSQTPWLIDGVRKGDSSVEEIISVPLVKLFSSESSKFSSAGREDIDVRMLGDGRPFVVQLFNSKLATTSLESLKEIEKSLEDSDVNINSLAISPSSCMDTRRENEMDKKKNYVCVVWVSKKIKSEKDLLALNFEEDLEVEQVTPLRVLHRRTLMTRKKVIHSARTELINQNFFILRLCASAGTYIKEFVHGDRGRTVPNVGTMLGCQADIIQLDVESLVLKS